MRDSYKPVLYLLASVVAGSLCLWFLIGQFLGSTNNIAADLVSRPPPSVTNTDPDALLPLSADLQRIEELEIEKALGATPVPKRDAANSSERTAGVESGKTPATAERADSDNDIVALKSIELLENELVSNADLQITELAETMPDVLSTVTEDTPVEAPLSVVKASVEAGFDVSLDLAGHCRDLETDAVRVGVLFRPRSFAIKGRSLSDIDTIIEVAKRCQPSVVVIERPASSTVEVDADLDERRADEIKYYLLQRGIDKNLMRFQDRS